MKNRLRRIGAVVFIGAAFVFLGRALLDQRDLLLAYAWDVAPFRLALSTAALIAALVGTAGVWALSLRSFGADVAFHTVVRLWFVSNVGRYIPGKIWQFVGVAEMSRTERIPPLVAVTSLTTTMGFILLAGWFVGIYLLPSADAHPWSEVIGPARWISPLLLVAVHPRVMNRLLAYASRLTRQPLGVWTGGWKGAWILFAASAGLWLAFGAAFHLFVTSITPLAAADLPALTAAYALAFVAGYVVLVAPAGLGVKEGALAVLLTPVMPLPVAAAVALASRVWTIAAELIPLIFVARARRGSTLST